MIGPGIQQNISKLDLFFYRLSLPFRLWTRRIIRQERARCAKEGR